MDSSNLDASIFGGPLFTFTTGTTSSQKIISDDSKKTPEVKENEIAGLSTTYQEPSFVQVHICTVSGDAKGSLTALGGDGIWTFRPSGNCQQIEVQDVIKDLDYLSFGYWLETTTKTDGSMTYGVNCLWRPDQNALPAM